MERLKRDFLRRNMVDSLISNGFISDIGLIDAFLKIPRDKFVLKEFEDEAYTDKPLYIGSNQTISRPSIVGYMLENAKIEPTDRVLEIGTGSGYQTAILSQLAGEVFSVEKIPELANKAYENLKSLGCKNIEIKIGDGREGWLKYSPFNAIIVSATAENLLKGLVDQLSILGRLIIPVEGDETQKIIKLVRHKHFTERIALGDCNFVKLYNGKDL